MPPSREMPPSEDKRETKHGVHKHDPINVRLGPIRDRFLAYVKRTGLAKNAVIRDAVIEFLDRHDAQSQDPATTPDPKENQS